MSKKRIVELDVMRAVAFIFVVLQIMPPVINALTQLSTQLAFGVTLSTYLL